MSRSARPLSSDNNEHHTHEMCCKRALCRALRRDVSCDRLRTRENVRDVTFREDAQRARTGNMPANCAAIRNLVIGTARKAGFANIAYSRRYYARDDQRILALYGYA
jgi:hypothetical protein